MPLIALTPSWNDEKRQMCLGPDYIDAVQRAGGAPVLLSFTDSEALADEMLSRMDGVLFTGGGDVNPACYGEEMLPCCGAPADNRDQLETLLLRCALRRGMPILGICRGIQFINAALRGTLWQDLPSQHPSDIEHHMNPPYDAFGHNVSLVPGTPLASLFSGQTEIAVNSYHHQAVREPAAGLEVMAVAPDGVIEALYRPASHFLWAVQWHPEFLYKVDPRSQTIFDAFVGSCR